MVAKEVTSDPFRSLGRSVSNFGRVHFPNNCQQQLHETGPSAEISMAIHILFNARFSTQLASGQYQYFRVRGFSEKLNFGEIIFFV